MAQDPNQRPTFRELEAELKNLIMLNLGVVCKIKLHSFHFRYVCI